MPTVMTIAKTDLTDIRADEVPARPLVVGEARLRIDRFSLTANNITYAVFGEAMQYWRFFPGPEGRGVLPVWGFGEVVESRAEGVPVGARYYGYFPFAQELVVSPARVSAAGFTDAAEHRAGLASVYNHYLAVGADPAYAEADEALIALLRPLFITSFLIDDFLADEGFFGARQALLSSASSRTALAAAFMMARRGGTEIIAATSPANRAFVAARGYYDRVLAYDEIDAADAATPTIYVDFSGSMAVRRAIHQHFGDRLKYSCAVGGSHWKDLGGASDLPGPRPTLFFAPDRVKKRTADWGGEGFQVRTADAWVAFLADARTWLSVKPSHGAEAAIAAYRDVLAGSAGPDRGDIVSL
jgi:NADPH:quinone reductase-like Zn-dependent oxidoreductase